MSNAHHHHPPLRVVEPDREPNTQDSLARRQLIRGLQGIDSLTPRERQLLGLMSEGMSNRAICDHLMLSTKTVETHVGHVFDKLGLGQQPRIHRRVMATRIAMTNIALREARCAAATLDVGDRHMQTAAV